MSWFCSVVALYNLCGKILILIHSVHQDSHKVLFKIKGKEMDVIFDEDTESPH